MPKKTQSKRVEDILCALHYLNSGEAGRFTVSNQPMRVNSDERKLRDELIADGFITETRHGSLALTQKGVDEAVVIMSARNLEEQLQASYPENREEVAKELDYWARRQQEGQPGSVHWEQVGGRINHLRHLEQRFAEAERIEALKQVQPTTRTMLSSEELLPANEAIRLLQAQLDDNVESLSHDDARVEIWRRLTQKIVSRAFGEGSQNAREYGVIVSYARQSDEEKQAWHVQHISEKKIMLRAFIKELEILSPHRPQAEDDRFARMAIDEARKSEAEDERFHPMVGCVVVKDGKVLATSHRGEMEGRHAEFIALEEKLGDRVLTGSTVYTTLEPCTTRNHPKIPCANRLIERRVACVVVGMHDPNPDICGKGIRKLQGADIEVRLFPHALIKELEELNRHFTRSFADSGTTKGLAEKEKSTTQWRNASFTTSYVKLTALSAIFAFLPVRPTLASTALTFAKSIPTSKVFGTLSSNCWTYRRLER